MVIKQDFSNIKEHEYGSRTSVVNLFMNLYKLQCGVPQLAPCEIIPINPNHSGSDYIYELRVKRRERWESRRMAISQIGETSVGTRTRGSKSVCFKVIYDNLLVVKVPPFPITNFQEYIKDIKAEGRIATRLDPKIEFVAPGVTAILKKVQVLPEGDNLTTSELERQYIRWLERNPRFQEYLKIGNAFVFFMDLSKYSFLSYVIEKIHDEEILKSRVREDIIKSYDLLWDVLGFEGKYGSENLSICFNMNKIYSDYESALRPLLKRYDISSSVSPYQKQEWYLFHLAEKGVEQAENHVPSQFLDDLNTLLKRIIDANRKDVEAYQQAVEKYIRKVIFEQNKVKMGVIIANLLDLLVWLDKRGVAIRDLKPDNLFVVGDAESPLASSGGSSLGLIDFETAVVFKTDQDEIEQKIPQPLLGGTPSYSTPSNLFPNELLKRMLGALPRIFHFQDWYAAIGMIYNVITGDMLFEKTRKILPRIKYMARKSVTEKQPLAEIFKKGSRMFWNSAMVELKAKTGDKEKIFKTVEIVISEEISHIFRQDISDEIRLIDKTIKKYIVSQIIFNSDKNRKSLLQSSSDDIRRYRTKWEKNVKVPKTSPEMRKQIIKFLQKLEYLKSELEQKKQLMNMLEQTIPRISAYELLEIMFNIVLKSMYNQEWGKLSENYAIDSNGVSDEDSDEGTILYEETIMYEITGTNE